jgi:ankyrin repeat protein
VNWPEVTSDDASELNTVQLAHFSVKEYLISDRVPEIPGFGFEIAVEGQQHLARDCIAYLVAFHAFEDPWELKKKRSYDEKEFIHRDLESKYPLLSHAVRNWYKYCRGEILGTCAEKITKVFLTGDLLAYEAAFAFKSRDASIYDPLTFSCEVESAGLVKLLICEGADVNGRSRKGYPLRLARDNDIIIKLLLDAGAVVDLVSGTGRSTALQRAVDRCSLSTIKLLIGRGANVNLNRGQGAGFALKSAALCPDQSKAIEVMRVLLDQGADINLRDEQGTALTAAISLRLTKIVRYLIDSGADLELQDNCQRTPLALATIKGLDTIADALLAGGAAMNPLRKKGERTLLQEAAYYGYDKLVKVFMRYGAEVNQSAFEAAVQGYLELGDYQTTRYNWDGVLRSFMSLRPVLDSERRSFKDLVIAFKRTTAPQLFFSVEDHTLERWKERHQMMFALIREAYKEPELTCPVDEHLEQADQWLVWDAGLDKSDPCWASPGSSGTHPNSWSNSSLSQTYPNFWSDSTFIYHESEKQHSKPN